MKLNIKSHLNIESIVPNLLLPLLVLAAYSGSFAVLSSRYLAIGLNLTFSLLIFSISIFVLILLVLYVAFCVIIQLSKEHKRTYSGSSEKPSVSDLILLILPLTPVAQYLINNREILTPLGTIIVIGFFGVLSFLFIFVIPTLFGRVGSTKTMMALNLAFTFTLTSMASLSHTFNWYYFGDIFVIFPFFLGTFLLTRLVYDLKIKKVYFVFIVISFLVHGISAFISQSVGSDSETPLLFNDENRLPAYIYESPPERKPNIYLLVYESYVPNETMLGYGIENRAQEDYLRQKGFTLYPHTYSVGSPTLESMSRVFNASTEFYGNRRRGVSGDGIVHNQFSYLGYKTYGLFPFDYMFRGVGSSYDFTITGYNWKDLDSSELMISAILLGEFRHDLGFFNISYDMFLNIKHRMFIEISDVLSFIYMHSNFPGHSQNSGVCRVNETDIFKENLATANLEMKQDIEIIISNDPEAIIIVAGDHGPYLTKNCASTSGNYDISEITRLDIQDRFATFLAIRWPTEDYEEYDEIMVLQDLFPAIFAYMYQDVTILESKIESLVLSTVEISGATVKNGIIIGGINDGEPLFISDN